MKLIYSLLLFFITSTSIVYATNPTEGIHLPENTGLPEPVGNEPIIFPLTKFVTWLLTIFLILAVLAFVITGLMYLFSMGDARSQNLENAKQYFKYAIIAVVTVGSSYIIIFSIDWLLRGVL